MALNPNPRCQGLADMVAVRAALRMRSVLVTSVYRHALSLSNKSRAELDKGKMVPRPIPACNAHSEFSTSHAP
jgi:hypothetical protein